MFVSESTLLMGTKLQMLSAEGQKWEVQIDPNATVAELKQMAFDKFYTTGTIDVNWDAFRVVFPAEFRTLTDSHAVHDEKLKDHDILLLVRRRSLVEEALTMDIELKAPTLDEIRAATNHLPKLEIPSSSAKTSQLGSDFDNWSEADFQLELRKIIISLVSVMTTLLHGNADAEAICRDTHAKVKNRLANYSNKHVEGTSFSYPLSSDLQVTPVGIVTGLIDLKKREFRPNPQHVDALRSMGYSDSQIIDALRVSKNNRLQASQWLSKTDRIIPEDIVVGLDPSCRLLSSLVTNPVIRLGLNNPKLLLAFFGIIESTVSANLWLSDPDTAPVLSTIFKLYHADKHLSN